MRRLVTACAVCLLACSKADRPATQTSGSDAGVGRTVSFGGTPVTGPVPPCGFEGLACDGQTPYRCASGVRQPQTACGGARPFCAAGNCVACPPAALRCDPDRPAVPQQCASDGSAWAALAACDEAAGARCTDGRCGDPCAVPDGSRGYLGCDYWATQTPNSQLDPAFPFAVALSNPQSFPVTVTISGGTLAESRVEELAPGAVRAVILPWVQELVQFSLDNPGCSDENRAACRGGWPLAQTATVTGGAYHVRSTAPVAAYQFNPLTFERAGGFHSYTNDASLLLSQRALTQRYVVLTAPNWPTGNEANTVVGGFIAVTAVAGETTSVTVHLPHNSGVPNDPEMVRRDNMMPGDVFVLVARGEGDLSGATVEASNSVAVFAGHDCTQVPQGVPACDHLEDQVAPLETLGRDFVVAPLADRPDLRSVVRVVAPLADTVLRFEPASVQSPVRLAAGEVFQIETAQAFHVTASHPVLVAQFMPGQGTTSRVGGDPAMLFEVPSQQFRDRYDLLVPATYTANFFGIVAPRGAHVLIDGEVLSARRTTIGAWDVLSTTVEPGAHRLRTAEGVPLGVKVYGTAQYTSYMYPGGLDLQLLPPG